MTEYSPELFETIIERVALGEPLAKICREDGMPNRRSFYDWIEKYSDIAPRFARAREDGYDCIAENARLVAKGEPNYSTGDVNRDKLIIETDLKLLAKWSRRYADKQQIELTGKDGTPLSVRLIEAQQRLLKDITPKTPLIEHLPAITPDDII